MTLEQNIQLTVAKFLSDPLCFTLGQKAELERLLGLWKDAKAMGIDTDLIDPDPNASRVGL